MNAARRELDALLLAVQFLTRWPVRVSGVFSEERLSAMVRYYPLVGALIGVFAGGVFWLAHLAFPMSLAVVLSIAASLLTTGALHEDGFADVCDGFGGADREKTLAIMHDSRLGTYGAAGLGLMLAMKFLALAALPPYIVPWLLIATHAASRSSVVLVIATSHYVRDAGMATPVAETLRPGGLLFALATGGVAVCGLGVTGVQAVIPVGLIGLAAGHLAMRGMYERRLGGYTGDCLGGVQQTSELGMYLGVVGVMSSP